MPIPFLIGAAVAVAAAAIAASSSEKTEQERQKQERAAKLRAQKEKERLEAEEYELLELARQEQEAIEEEQRARNLITYSYETASVLAQKYSIRDIFLDEIAELAIYDTEECQEKLKFAYLKSEPHLKIEKSLDLLEKQLEEADELLNTLITIK